MGADSSGYLRSKSSSRPSMLPTNSRSCRSVRRCVIEPVLHRLDGKRVSLRGHVLVSHLPIVPPRVPVYTRFCGEVQLNKSIRGKGSGRNKHTGS